MEENEIMKYVMEQADRNDGKNLQYEQDILFKIRQAVDLMVTKCLTSVLSNVKDVSAVTRLQERLDKHIDTSIRTIRLLMVGVASNYYETAYNQCNDLISIGMEVSNRFESKVTEIANVQQDDDTIEYIERYSLQLLTGYSEGKKNELRSKIGYLMLAGKGDKVSIRNAIEKILNTNRAKAEQIAQTELAMAFNAGMLRRMNEWSQITGDEVLKYWHGFKYSEKTCDYCRPRIGTTYAMDDDSEHLPAHPYCRCCWLPMLKKWNKPATNRLLAKANLLNLGYSLEDMQRRINNRLGINYAGYLSEDAASDYILGDRTTKIDSELLQARNQYVNDLIQSWDIEPDTTGGRLANEFNQQLKWMQQMAATAIADADYDMSNRVVEAIKGLMVLPWTAEQMDKWNTLINRAIR